MESNNIQQDYYIEYYEAVDEILNCYLETCQLPSFVATVLFEKSFSLKEPYNKLRSEGMAACDAKEFVRNKLIPDFRIEKASIMPDVIIPMPDLLKSLGNRLVVYVYNSRQLNYLCPLIETINRPLLLLCEQSVDIALEMPEYVEAIDLDYSIIEGIGLNNDPITKKISKYFILLNSLMRSSKVDGVIVLEGCHFQEQMLGEIAKNINIPSIALQQGWPSLMHTMFRRLPYTHFLTWGKVFNNLWKVYSPKTEFISTGYPYPVKAKYGSAISFFLQSPLFISSESYYEIMIELIGETAKRFSDRIVLVREHPEFRMSKKKLDKLREFFNVKIATEYPLEEVFSLSEIVVSHFSSSLIEGLVHNCIPIVFDPTTDSNYIPNVESLGIGCMSKNFSDFFDKITRVQLIKDDYLKAIASQQTSFFSAFGHEAALNQAEIVNKIAPLQNDQIALGRLNIGCGKNVIVGWLNADLYTVDPNVLQMDASKHFPFADESLNYIFSEHMFEHLDLIGQQSMMAECYRTLNFGGVLRIAMPDFEFLIGLVNNPDIEINRKYLDWSYNRFVARNVNFRVPHCDYPVYVVNNFMHDWGHQFIHTKHSLIQMGKFYGFSKAEVCQSGLSAYPVLCGCEKHENEMPSWANCLETMVIEFCK